MVECKWLKKRNKEMKRIHPMDKFVLLKSDTIITLFHSWNKYVGFEYKQDEELGRDIVYGMREVDGDLFGVPVRDGLVG